MNVEKFFTSSFKFSVYEYEIKARVMTLNALLLVFVIILPIMTVVRFIQGNLLQGTVNLIIAALSVSSLFWLRGNKNRIPIVARIACLAGWVLVSSLLLNVPEDPLRLGWYLVLLAPTFFLCGTGFGILVSALSFLAVVTVHIFSNSGYSNYDILYFANLCVIITIFFSFYEYKVTRNRIQLQELSRELESTVLERTAELTKVNQELVVFFQALDSSPDSVIVTDMNGVINYCNKAALNFSGYAENEALGQTADIFFSEANSLTEHILPHQREHGWWEDEFQAKRKSGTVFPAFAGITNILDNTDTPLGILFILRDLTEIKRAEQEKIQLEGKLQLAEKMEAIGLMAGGVAHDLNNILSGLVSLPDFLLMKLEKDSDIRRPVELIKQSGLRASAVVEDLLTVASGVAKTSERIDLNALINAHLQSPEHETLMGKNSTISIQSRLSSDINNITCSTIHVKKSLKSLILNAFEAMPEGGNCLISTSSFLVKNDNMEKLQPGEYVLLTVEDEGAGINAEDLEHIFEPFYTKKKMGRTGTGLGLTVVWNTMQEHNGAVTVQNTVKGTAFQLYFPCSERTARVRDSQPDPSLQNDRGKTILVVDDEELLRTIATGMLQAMGYAVHTAASGEEAIAWVKDNPVDVILLDMLMEPGISGLQTYEEILKIYPEQKAVVASGFADHDDVKKTLQLGAADFIKKPYTMQKLSTVLHNIPA